MRPHLKSTNDSYRVDETYVKIQEGVALPVSGG